ncbi:hypothetical protein SK128_020873 [Halocaridina rubra]|uniref:Neurotransmitter-gated ion-channel ligand-binding domain-containing protein n=1 Tax=Halocaridina rubra TaxID=373956 RepID=A0AAN8WVT2_HALRR
MIYEGKSADVVKKEHYSGIFGCSFDVFYYPFDTQTCYLLFQLSTRLELVEFTGEKSHVVYLEDPKLPAYLLSKYFITVIEGGNNETRYSTLKVEFELNRRYRMIILNVYLPTGMLQIVGYTTLYVNVVLMDVSSKLRILERFGINPRIRNLMYLSPRCIHCVQN